jgi:hypothetical protein
VALLAGLAWLQHAEILYWGDIDAEGFEILDNLLQYFPQAKAFCMDKETLESYKQEWVAGSGASAKPISRIEHGLQQVYRFVCTNNIRLEQEQVYPDWVSKQLQQFFSVL